VAPSQGSVMSSRQGVVVIESTNETFDGDKPLGHRINGQEQAFESDSAE
jgi:hypothetical protein